MAYPGYGAYKHVHMPKHMPAYVCVFTSPPCCGSGGRRVEDQCPRTPPGVAHDPKELEQTSQEQPASPC